MRESGAALLALEFIAAPHDRRSDSGDVGARVHDNKVLSSRLADQTRIRAIRAIFSPTFRHIPWNTSVEPVK